MATFSHAIRGVAVTAVLIATLAACSPSPSPTPIASAAPSGEPAPSPIIEGEATPTPGPSPTQAPLGGLAAGWHHEITCGANGRRCRVHLYDERAREVPGWPVAIAGSCWEGTPATGPDGTVYAACSARRDVTVHALNTRGRPVDGWPKRLDGDDAHVNVTTEGSVVVGVSGPRWPDYRLASFTSAGDALRGWPVALPGFEQGFDVGGDGSIVAWWYEGSHEDGELNARRTVFTRLDLRGRPEPGWPIGSKGAASSPLALDDGGIVYTSEKGRVWRHDRTGAVADGWPFQLPDPWSVPPIRRGDRFVFIGDGWVTVVRPDGAEAAGWPWRSRASFAAPMCDTGSRNGPPPLVAWAADDTLYLGPQSQERSTVVALDSRGRVKPGYPWVVPGGWSVHGLEATPDGGVTVQLGAWCDPGPRPRVTLDAQGRTGDDPGTSLQAVYEALEFEELYTSDGRDVYAPGEQINFFVNLRNTTERAIELARLDGDPTEYTAGTVTSSIRRLSDDEPIDCLPRRGGGWYEIEEQVISFEQPVRLEATESTVVSTHLFDDQTSCLGDGDYVVRVVYSGHPVNEDWYPRLDRSMFNFTITDGP